MNHDDPPLPKTEDSHLRAMSAARKASDGFKWNSERKRFELEPDDTARKQLMAAGKQMHAAYSGDSVARSDEWVKERDGFGHGNIIDNTLAFIDSTASRAHAGTLDALEAQRIQAMASHPGNTGDFTSAARGSGGNHELFNAANVPSVMMQMATGTHPTMPSTGQRKDGGRMLPSALLGLTIPTRDYSMRPVSASTTGISHFGGDTTKMVAHGHVGSASVQDSDGKLHPVVTNQGASRGVMHESQRSAPGKHKSYTGLIRELVKITDRHMARGDDYLDAHDNTGFHPDTRVPLRDPSQGVSALITPGQVLEKGLQQETARKKQRTKAKRILDQLDESTDESDIEATTDVDSDNEGEYYNKRLPKKARYQVFATKHGLDQPANGGPPPPPPAGGGVGLTV